MLDELEHIAPVFAAYGNGEELWRVKPDSDPRMKKKQIIVTDGIHIGLTHIIGAPEAPLEKCFDDSIDIAVCGHSHLPSIKEQNNVIIVNPGSACMPNHMMNELGTVGIIDIGNNNMEIRILQLDQNDGTGYTIQEALFQKKN